MFGHYGHGFGAWLTPLGGITDQTLCAFYGVGPNHQDLAIHQDALILNYFGANHYGLPGYSLPAGYRRLYGPWFTYITAGDPANPQAMIADAARLAETEIAENRGGSSWVDDALYSPPTQRATVTGRSQIADGRPADGFWVLLSTQNVTDIYTIHEPTYFVKTDAQGSFALPGIPPATAAGTMNPRTYVLYIFASKGSITDQYKQTGVAVSGPVADLGTISWPPVNHTTFLWQIGQADRMSGEFAQATNLAELSNPRSYEKPLFVPVNLTWTVGSSWEPQDWSYAQTNAGVWTVAFNLDRVYTGTAFLTVSTSMQQGGAPVVSVNGSSAGLTGSLPTNSDSTISRQADRSGYPRRAIISFPASRLLTGANTIKFTKSGGGAGSGPGWDTLVLEAEETEVPTPAQLSASIPALGGSAERPVWTVRVSNLGGGAANDVRLDGAIFAQTFGSLSAAPAVLGRNPNTFPVPLGNIPAGGFTDYRVSFDFEAVAIDAEYDVLLPISANGGHAHAQVHASQVQTSPIGITRGGFSLNRRTGKIVQQVTLNNVASVPVAGPLYLVLDEFSSNTSLTNGNGWTSNNAPLGRPYIQVTNTELAPGASAVVSLSFAVPASGGINYSPRVLAGDDAP